MFVCVCLTVLHNWRSKSTLFSNNVELLVGRVFIYISGVLCRKYLNEFSPKIMSHVLCACILCAIATPNIHSSHFQLQIARAKIDKDF